MEIFLSDKQIPDLETMDDVLLEVLQLEQLRLDMESIRDDLIHQYRQYQENEEPQGSNYRYSLANYTPKDAIIMQNNFSRTRSCTGGSSPSSPT